MRFQPVKTGVSHTPSIGVSHTCGIGVSHTCLGGIEGPVLLQPRVAGWPSSCSVIWQMFTTAVMPPILRSSPRFFRLFSKKTFAAAFTFTFFSLPLPLQAFGIRAVRPCRHRGYIESTYSILKVLSSKITRPSYAENRRNESTSISYRRTPSFSFLCNGYSWSGAPELRDETAEGGTFSFCPHCC